jgi:hypothetical protein
MALQANIERANLLRKKIESQEILPEATGSKRVAVDFILGMFAEGIEHSDDWIQRVVYEHEGVGASRLAIRVGILTFEEVQRLRSFSPRLMEIDRRIGLTE